MNKIFSILIIFLMAITPSFAQSDIQITKDGIGIYVIKVPLNKYKDKIKPYVSDELITSSELFNSNPNYKLVVNGGFFDVITGAPVSNVKINKKEVQSLFENIPLVEKLEKQKRVEGVLNRSELRILTNNKGDIFFDIKNHMDPVIEGYEILHSLQAGPMILPDLKLEEESFIKNTRNKTISLAADVLKRRERTVIGIKEGLLKGNYLYIIIFTSDHKAAMNEVRDYCIKLGLNKAMAMDGGASTSFNAEGYEIFSTQSSERRLKSFLVIEK